MYKLGKNHNFNSRQLYLVVSVCIVTYLFLTDSILYWVSGIILTQVYILSSEYLNSRVADKIPNKLLKVSFLSTTGFVICLTFFSITEALSPSKQIETGIVAGIMDTQKSKPIEKTTNQLANQNIRHNTEPTSPVAVTQNVDNMNTEQSSIQETKTDLDKDQKPIAINSSAKIKNAVTTNEKTQRPKTKRLINTNIDYKTKLTYDYNNDGRVNCKDFAGSVTDKKVLHIFPGLDPDMNGIGCE